jgi:hypothetical protein
VRRLVRAVSSRYPHVAGQTLRSLSAKGAAGLPFAWLSPWGWAIWWHSSVGGCALAAVSGGSCSWPGPASVVRSATVIRVAVPHDSAIVGHRIQSKRPAPHFTLAHYSHPPTSPCLCLHPHPANGTSCRTPKEPGESSRAGRAGSFVLTQAVSGSAGCSDLSQASAHHRRPRRPSAAACTPP